MILDKIEIRKSELASMPQTERVFFLQLANLLNDVNILRKVTFFSANLPDDVNPTIRIAQNMQALFFIRIQAGKLYEAWKFLKRDFFSSKLSVEYEERMTRRGKEAREEIKRYFKKTNPISIIRNEFAFHYSPLATSKIEEMIKRASDAEVYEVFLSEQHGNCLYAISHVLSNLAMLEVVESGGPEEAVKILLQDISRVTGWFQDFLGDCLVVILRKYPNLGRSETEIPKPPPLNQVTLPFFTS